MTAVEHRRSVTPEELASNSVVRALAAMVRADIARERGELSIAAAHARRVAATPGPKPRRPLRRRRFAQSVLARYPLTQPPDECQRCGAVGDGPLELDHMMEMVCLGPDHPHNLIRLCTRCHRAKPFFDYLTSLVEWRLAVITWATQRPMVTWHDPV